MRDSDGEPDDATPSACDELIAAYLEADAAGQPPDRKALVAEHPEMAAELEEFFQHHERMAHLSSWWRAAVGEEAATRSGDSTAAWQYRPTKTAISHPALPGYEILHEIARRDGRRVSRPADEPQSHRRREDDPPRPACQ